MYKRADNAPKKGGTTAKERKKQWENTEEAE